MRLATASSQIPHANFSQKASCQATITPLPRPSRLPHMSLKLRTSESMICAAISLSLFSAQRETAKQTKWIDFNRELCKRMCKMKMLLFVFLTLIFFAFQKQIHRGAEAVKLEARSLALVQTEDNVRSPWRGLPLYTMVFLFYALTWSRRPRSYPTWTHVSTSKSNVFQQKPAAVMHLHSPGNVANLCRLSIGTC